MFCAFSVLSRAVTRRLLCVHLVDHHTRHRCCTTFIWRKGSRASCNKYPYWPPVSNIKYSDAVRIDRKYADKKNIHRWKLNHEGRRRLFRLQLWVWYSEEKQRTNMGCFNCLLSGGVWSIQLWIWHGILVCRSGTTIGRQYDWSVSEWGRDHLVWGEFNSRVFLMYYSRYECPFLWDK